MIKRHLIAIIFLSVISALLLYRNVAMGNTPLADWDESIYARVAYEVANNKSLEMTYNGDIWVEKPPFIIYLTALVLLVTSSEMWLRMISVVLSIVLLVLVYVVARNIMSSLFAKQIKNIPEYELQLGALLPVFFLLSSSTFVDRTTLVNYDIPLALGWIAYCAANSYTGRLAALFIGVWSKSLLGYFPVLIDITSISKKTITPGNILKTLLLLVLPFTWHIVNYLVYGQRFIQLHFIDHLIKRVTTPIELHFGGRLFYVKFLYSEYSFLLILPAIAFALLAFFVIKDLVKKKKLPDRSTMILISPVVFFAFLTFSMTKIWWYMISFLPLFALSISYLYMKIPGRWARYVLAAAVLCYFLYIFIPKTALFKPDTTKTEKVQLAECVNKLEAPRIAFLVDAQERQNKQVFEAANIGISSSFIYGGSPAFIYYSEKQVDFYYDANDFERKLRRYSAAISTKTDLTELRHTGRILCETDTYSVIEQ